MRSKIVTVAIALALVGACVAPASAAQAASATVSGTVEYKGKPIAGIPVGWFKPATGSYRVVTTANDGSYSLALPGAGQEYVLFGNMNMENTKQSRGNKDYVGVFYGDGDTRDYAYQTVDPYTATATSDEVDLELAKPGSISGYDTHMKGQEASLETLSGHRVAHSSGATTEFRNLVPGQYRVVSEIYNDYQFDDIVVTVASGAQTKLATNAVTGGVVSGVAKSSDGKVAAGVRVTATSTPSETDSGQVQSDWTDSKGRYSIPHLHDSSYTLTFGDIGATSDPKTGDRGYLPKSTKLTGVTPTSKIIRDVTLSIGGRLRGNYPDNSSSSRSYNTFTLLDSDGDNVLDGIYGVDYVDGAFTYGSLPTGKYTAYFQNTNSSTFAKKTFTVKAGATTDLGTIKRDRKAVTLTGSLTDLSSSANDVGLVTLQKVDGPLYYLGGDDYGVKSYSLKTLVPGTYTVKVYGGAREVKTYTVALAANTTKNFAVGPKWGATRATLEVNGLPIPGGELYLGPGTANSLGRINDGLWSITGPAGNYDSVIWFNPESVFQANSPFGLALPEGTLPVAVKTATTTNLGTIPVVVE